jgi:hypothetical protein
MKTIIRRQRRLEDQFCPSMETESSRRLRESLEAGLRRVAEAKKRNEWSGSIDDGERENLAGLSVMEILDRGRARIARAKVQKGEADIASGLASRSDAVSVSGSPTKLADHNDEEHSAFVPAAEPARAPAIDKILQGHGPSKPKALSLNSHVPVQTHPWLRAAGIVNTSPRPCNGSCPSPKRRAAWAKFLDRRILGVDF